MKSKGFLKNRNWRLILWRSNDMILLTYFSQDLYDTCH